MGPNEINGKISETEKNIMYHEVSIRAYQTVLKTLQSTLDSLKKEKKKEELWIAAVGKPSPDHPRLPTRLILNLTALSSSAKDLLKEALDKEVPWISFDRYGEVGALGDTAEHGLLFYHDTNIIFGGKQK